MSVETATDQELIERIARCWNDRERLELELAGCTDTASACLDELLERRHPFPAGAAFAETFNLWLADAMAQRWHKQGLEMRRQAEQLLREWEERDGRE